MINGVVAIVGRPNVGKSTLFNRLIGERLSIVEDVAGVTRDRIYAKANWLTKEFRLIDTGGIQLADQPFLTEIKAQAEIAIEEADVIVMVCNGKDGVTKDDEVIAKMLQKTRKPVILAINKIDNIELKNNIYEFYSLGIGDPVAVSSTHGIGTGDLLDEIIANLPKEVKKEKEGVISFSLIGRPNVGKSSLTNTILNEERVIVSDIEGTTRDAIDTNFTKDGQDYCVIDTAGMKKRGKVYENIEKYSVLRALSAIDRSDVVLVLIDASVGIIEQDKHVAGYAHEAGKPIIIVVNKWDLVDKDEKSMKNFELLIREEFKFLDYAFIAFVSAATHKRVHTLFPLILQAYGNSHKRVSTSVLNDVIIDAQAMNPTPNFNGGRLKIYYSSQVSEAPPTFVMFVNDTGFAHFSYIRYLENQLRANFGFEGTPLKIITRKRT